MIQTLRSEFKPLGAIVFPQYKGRQRYMHICHSDVPYMPWGFEDYTPVLRQLVQDADIHHRYLHITVDEKIVAAGMSQRRPKPHVDGCFMPQNNIWGHDGWLHYCNQVGEPYKRMAVIVAATVPGCKAWVGEFKGSPKEDGDLSHIQDQLDEAYCEVFPANQGFLLSPDCVHESLIFEKDTQRQFLRIAFQE